MLGPDGLVAAAIGGVLALWLARRRVRCSAPRAALIAVVALAAVATSGLPIQDRYVFLIAALGAVFGGAGLFGWRTLEPGDRRRRLWQARRVVIAVAIVASIAWQVPRFNKTFNSSKPADQSLDAQQRIAADLVALTKRGAITTDCLPISVPYATPVPLLALYLHTSPVNVVVGADRRAAHTSSAADQRRLRPVPARQERPATKRRRPARLSQHRREPLMARLRKLSRAQRAPIREKNGPCTLRRGSSCGAAAGRGSGQGAPDRACRHPLKAASFRT